MGDIDTDVTFSNAETGRMPTPNKLNLLWQNAKLNAGAISNQPAQGGAGDGDYLLVLGKDGKLYKVNVANLMSVNALGNPTFEVDQRQLGTGGVVLGAGQFIVDRWLANKGGLAGATLSSARQQTKLVLGPKGYAPSSVYIQQAGTPVATLAAGDFVTYNQAIEGPFAATLVGRPMSLTLMVYCSQGPFTFTVSFRDPGTTQSYVALATVPVASQWTTITIPNIPAPTGGGFTAANALPGVTGMYFNIILACGTTMRAPVANQWVSGNFISAPGAGNFAGFPTNAIFYLAFAQLEAGSVCSPPSPIPFDQNLLACYRYYSKSYDYATKPGVAAAAGQITNMMTASSTAALGYYTYRLPMVKIPNVITYSTITGLAGSVRDIGAALDRGVTQIAGIGAGSFSGVVMGSAGAANARFDYQYTADTGF